MNLVEQCVQGEGLVQVNVELKSAGGIKKINIVDVLKPADDNLRSHPDINFLTFSVLFIPIKIFRQTPWKMLPSITEICVVD